MVGILAVVVGVLAVADIVGDIDVGAGAETQVRLRNLF